MASSRFLQAEDPGSGPVHEIRFNYDNGLHASASLPQLAHLMEHVVGNRDKSTSGPQTKAMGVCTCAMAELIAN